MPRSASDSYSGPAAAAGPALWRLVRPGRTDLLGASLRKTRAHSAAAAALPVAVLDLSPPVDGNVAEDVAGIRALICSLVFKGVKPNRLSILTSAESPFFPLRSFRLLVQGKDKEVEVGPRVAELKARVCVWGGGALPCACSWTS